MLLQGKPEQGKPPRAGMLLGEAGFLQWTSLQAFSWQGEHLLEMKAVSHRQHFKEAPLLSEELSLLAAASFPLLIARLPCPSPGLREEEEKTLGRDQHTRAEG